MNTIAVGHDQPLDVLFSLDGQALPLDHAQALQIALCHLFPWLQTDAVAAVLPVKLVAGEAGQSLVSRRSKLILRVQQSRLPDLLAVSGVTLSVAGCQLRLVDPHPRELQPHATLYAYKVASSGAGEAVFMAAVHRGLEHMAIRGELVCGKRGQMMVDGQMLETYSLMLHGLAPDQSMRLQQFGLGQHRLLGCGVFVPHKSAAAV